MQSLLELVIFESDCYEKFLLPGFEKKRIAHTKSQDNTLSGIRILLAEDNEINQQVARELLKQGEAQVDITGNGEKAVEAVKRNAYDLVFLDIQMPVLDGLEAERSIRATEKGRSLPLIAMTAHAMRGDRAKSLQAGMDDHITKPIPGGTLRKGKSLLAESSDGRTRESRKRAQYPPRYQGLEYRGWIKKLINELKKHFGYSGEALSVKAGKPTPSRSGKTHRRG